MPGSSSTWIFTQASCYSTSHRRGCLSALLESWPRRLAWLAVPADQKNFCYHLCEVKFPLLLPDTRSAGPTRFQVATLLSQGDLSQNVVLYHFRSEMELELCNVL